MRIVTAIEDSIREAASLLKEGGLVAFPTETVYGLGANALDGTAVARIFEAKGRPQFNPLIVHVSNKDQAAALVEFNEWAETAAHHFWPGPLTLILPRKEDCPVNELVSAGLDTLAIRVPSHPVALALLKAAGIPVAAPSANASGTLSPTSPIHVEESLGNKIDMILAAGSCAVGLESTVLDCSGDVPVILRPGAVTTEELSRVLECDVKIDSGDSEQPKSPGMLQKHYAPSIPVRLNAIDLEPGEALLAFGSDTFMGVKGGGSAKDLPETQRRNLSEDGDLNEAAAHLFMMLRALDKPEHKAIAVMAVPEQGLGVAISDRLRRAAEGSS